MDINRWRQIDELLDAVLEIPNERREAFLSEKCSGDDELKREVLSLLKAQKETDAFLENSAMNLMAKEIAHDGTTVVDFSILGRELGNYRIERPLGAGGMGEVFLAHDSKLNRKVALKILPAEFVLDSERVKRFEREAKAVSALNHPNIVTIYDFGQLNGINFIVTEHIEGKTVRELINAKVSLKETLNVVSQTCEALHAAHKSGIIHRDIKPENIMVRPDGYAKVLDFGLAKLNPQADSIHVSLANYTQKGMIIGTLAYMSPEQISDDTVDQRADLWSLGVVLYEMATGKKPFQAESKQATFNAILSGEPLAATDSNASLPVELDRILEKALEKDKDLRYQTASDFRADLKRVRREIDSSPSSSWSKSMRRTNPQTIQTTEKSRLIYAVPLAALILITAGVACYFYWQKYATQPAPNWTQARNEHLTDEPGTEFMPSLAPDGEAFIYVAKNGEKYDIFRRRVGGKNATNLTPDTANEDETHPAYSPDGKRIAFRSTRYPAGIYLMESTGENPRRLCKDGYHPAWSPDGKEIVSSEEDQNLPGTRYKSRLIITNVATGEQRVLHDGYAAQPQWSPHGQRVAFWIMQPGGKRDVATISATGGEPVLVTDLSGVNWNPVWSPDGNYLYFASDRKGNMGFWRMRIDETSGKVLGEPESVPTPAKFVRHLSFSRDGKRLIYVQTEDESNLKAVKFDQAAEKIVGEPFSITRREQEVVRPEISPDGKQFVMRLTRLTQHDIAAVGGGGGWRDFTNDEFSENYPRWSPDGNRIAYVSDRSGNYEIWTMDADGTNHQQWTFGNQTSASYPFWSPDGQKLGYDFNHKAYILDLTKPPGEQKPELLPGAENYSLVIAWDWSPDGKKLSGIFTEKGKQFAKDDNGLRVGYYSFDTGRWEDLNIATYNLRWLADSSRLIYYDEGNKAYIVDIHTKKSRVVFAPPNEEQLKSVGINRPEDLIYYTNFSSESDVWMLDLSENQ